MENVSILSKKGISFLKKEFGLAKIFVNVFKAKRAFILEGDDQASDAETSLEDSFVQVWIEQSSGEILSSPLLDHEFPEDAALAFIDKESFLIDIISDKQEMLRHRGEFKPRIIQFKEAHFDLYFFNRAHLSQSLGSEVVIIHKKDLPKAKRRRKKV